MMTQDRNPLLQAIAELCDRYPNWRLGQLVANVAGWADVDVWDVEDEQLLAAARTHLQHIASRGKEGSSEPVAASDRLREGRE